jgi:hypothetical protein
MRRRYVLWAGRGERRHELVSAFFIGVDPSDTTVSGRIDDRDTLRAKRRVGVADLVRHIDRDAGLVEVVGRGHDGRALGLGEHRVRSVEETAEATIAGREEVDLGSSRNADGVL